MPGSPHVVSKPCVLSDEVRLAMEAGRPVVALESTLICHGLPWPDNLEAAEAIEAAVRAEGAVPATIAVVAGAIRVGLDGDTLRALAAGGDAIAKCSTRDLALAIARQEHGATTIAATIQIASLAGLTVMATGGLGGVHRGGERSLDISADLVELRRSRCVVVCSGPKAILDVGRTAEALETQGVAVVGYATDRLPGFYVEATAIPVPRIDDLDGLAALVRAQAALGWPGSIVVGNPPPTELALSAESFAALMAKAEAEADAKGVQGAALTPFLLGRLAALSEGRSTRLNRALVVANAGLAARLAARLASGSAQEFVL